MEIMQSQMGLNDELNRLRKKRRRLVPTMMAALDVLSDEIYTDGALPCKFKHLLALGIALRAGCTTCIIGHTKQAIESGATADEILETTSVAMIMSGTTAHGEGLRVVKVLEELGKL